MIEPASSESSEIVDMSGEAISERLDLVSSLYDLGNYLAQAQPVDSTTNTQPRND